MKKDCTIDWGEFIKASGDDPEIQEIIKTILKHKTKNENNQKM
jgi:hypothetical protein